MEFVKANLVNTTTQITVGSNTTVVENLINRDPVFQYITENFDDDNTTASITIAFDATQTVDRLALIEHNLKDFTLFYNGATANTFALTTTAATTTSDFSTNSETSIYMRSTQVNVTSVTLDMSKTIVADSEKAIGYIIVSDNLYTFDRVPSSKNYKPRKDPKQVKHTLSDGGVRLHRVENKQKADIKWKYIDEDERNSLENIYDNEDSFIYVPFGTTTSWDAIAPEMVWTNDWNFNEYSDDAANSGFSGSIKLEETPY